jgi:hypothetical protein
MNYDILYDLILNYKFATVRKHTRNGVFRQNNLTANVGMVRLFRKGLPIVEGDKMKRDKRAIYNECKRLYPNHQFTGIMLNKNFQCEPHKDKGNEGPVIIIGLGNYTGGELVAGGVEYNIRNTDVTFEASKIEHYVKPFEGDRYSVVLFKHKNCNYEDIEAL